MKINRGERELLTREKLSQFTYVLYSSKLFTFFHLIFKIQYCSFHHPYFINKEISSEKLSNWFKGTQLNGNPYFESCFSGLWSSHSFQPSPPPGFSDEDFFFFCNQQGSGRMEMLLTWHTGWGLVWGAVLQLWEAHVYRSVNVGKVSLHVGTSKDIIAANRLLGSVLAPILMGRSACLASWPSWGLWTENLSGSWRVELATSLRCDALEAL